MPTPPTVVDRFALTIIFRFSAAAGMDKASKARRVLAAKIVNMMSPMNTIIGSFLIVLYKFKIVFDNRTN